ncbi:MAG: hypothetical protein ACTSSI_08530 [Candidatus Helarchaeota archaeon]
MVELIELREAYTEFCKKVGLQHEKNVKKWGIQEIDILLLATMEELGELSQAFLQANWENQPRERIESELIDLAALLPAIYFKLKEGKH